MLPYGIRPRQFSEDFGPPSHDGPLEYKIKSKHRRELRRRMKKQARADAKRQLVQD